MKNTNHLKTTILASIYIFTLSIVTAQAPLATSTFAKHSVFSSFYNEDCIDITLESDFDKLIKNKRTIAYQDAWINYTTNDGRKIKQLIHIRPRGKSRRTICGIPPIMMNFAKGNPEAKKNYTDHKLKLVTHCLDDRTKKGQQNILKEFLAYKLLNILTEKSYRVQLVRINYLDTINNNSSQRYGFIIEGNKELAKRLDSTRKKEWNISLEQFERDQYNTVALFQYMISNSDWNINQLHNVKILASNSSRKKIIIPYDFDYSNFVNTGYAKVNPNHAQKNLNERIFLGKFDDEKQLCKTLDLFDSKKEEINSYCESANFLSKKNRRYVQAHIKEFYKIIKRRKFVKREFL